MPFSRKDRPDVPLSHPGAPLPPAMDGKLFFTVPEVAGMFRADQRTIRAHVRPGTSPAVKIGVGGAAHWRIPAAWVREQAGLPAA